MPFTDKDVSVYFKKLNKRSQKSQFGSMTKEQKSEHFRRLQKLSTRARKATGQTRTVR